jgi:hypothetical protein
MVKLFTIGGENFIRAAQSCFQCRFDSHVVFHEKHSVTLSSSYLLTLCTFFSSPPAAAAATTESKGMTSLPTPSAHQFTSDTQMEQLLSERRAKEVSRMPPDGHEFPSNRMLNGIEKQPKRFVRIKSFVFYVYCFISGPQFCGFKMFTSDRPK